MSKPGEQPSIEIAPRYFRLRFGWVPYYLSLGEWGMDMRHDGALTVALIGVALTVSGCITGKAGTEYDIVARKLGSPKVGQSRVVFLSEKGSYSSGACELAIDSRTVGRVQPGTYAYADVPAGRHALVATQTLFPGNTKLDFSAEAGRTQYFVVRNSDKSKAMSTGAIVGGLTGVVVMAVATSANPNQGPVDIYPLDERSARLALSDLLQVE